jgi:allophanate hydrolase subunit 2
MQRSRSGTAISGGIDVPLVLGSRSTDLRGNFGGHEGRALRDGDELLLAREGGHSLARVVHAGGDATVKVAAKIRRKS